MAAWSRDTTPSKVATPVPWQHVFGRALPPLWAPVAPSPPRRRAWSAAVEFCSGGGGGGPRDSQRAAHPQDCPQQDSCASHYCSQYRYALRQSFEPYGQSGMDFADAVDGATYVVALCKFCSRIEPHSARNCLIDPAKPVQNQRKTTYSPPRDRRTGTDRTTARHRSFFRSANLGDDRVGAFFGLSARSDPRA